MSSYQATVRWDQGDGEFLADDYSRGHVWSFDGGGVIVRHDELLEPGRAGHVGALTDIDEVGGGLIGHG